MTFKIILNALLIVTSTLVSCKDNKTVINQNAQTVVYSTEGTVQFTGIITNAKNDCWVDGICSIEVNNEWWVAIVYGKRDPSTIPKERGRATGIRFTEDHESIGKTVKIYAKIKNKKYLTLEGDKAYYVEVIETKN